MAQTALRRHRARKRWWVWLVAVVLAAAVAGALLRRGGPVPQRVYLETVQRGEFVREVTGTGTVDAARTRLLVFPTSGTVARVEVREGQRVEAGSALASLDTRALERELASDRAALASAQADLARVAAQQRIDRLDALAAVSAAENALARAQRASVDARDDLATTEQLYRAGGVSENDLQAARKAVDETSREESRSGIALQSARTRLSSLDALAQAQLESARANGARLETAVANVRQQIADATLRAPFGGVVAALPFKVGDQVAPGVPQGALQGSLQGSLQGISFVDDSSVSVTADFDENRSVDLAVGQDASIAPDAAPDLALPGVVERVDPVATRANDTARLRAEIAFKPVGEGGLPRAAVRPGYTVTARVVVRRIADALLVPLEAVQSEGASSYVFRVRRESETRGSVERVEVAVLDRNATLAALGPGALQPGDEVAATNVDKLETGEAVSFEAAGGGR